MYNIECFIIKSRKATLNTCGVCYAAIANIPILLHVKSRCSMCLGHFYFLIKMLIFVVLRRGALEEGKNILIALNKGHDSATQKNVQETFYTLGVSLI